MMAPNDVPLYPLQFEPVFGTNDWGGRRLETWGRRLPGADPIGESWELRGGASPAGTPSVVRNGPLRGRSLQEVVRAYGPRLLGDLHVSEPAAFPLSARFVDAGRNTPVMVSPGPIRAAAQGRPDSRFEAWYVVEADAGAVVYKGLRRGVTVPTLRDAVDANDANTIERMLNPVPARPGDCHCVPGGTAFALGAGVLAAVVQTEGETFALHDWGRGRSPQVEAALACIDPVAPDAARYEKRSHIAGMFTTISRLALCDGFRIERVRMVESYEQELPYDQPAVWMVLDGAGRIDPGNGAEPVAYGRGQTMLIPARLNDARLAIDQDTVWLEITFPQAMPERIA